MALVKEVEKEAMGQISHRVPATVVKRYRALLDRSKKQRVNLPASFTELFTRWLDEVEAELNTMNVSKLRTPAKADD